MTNEGALLFFHEWATNPNLRSGDDAIASALVQCGSPEIQYLARKALEAQQKVIEANSDLVAAKAAVGALIFHEMPDDFKKALMERESGK